MDVAVRRCIRRGAVSTVVVRRTVRVAVVVAPVAEKESSVSAAEIPDKTDSRVRVVVPRLTLAARAAAVVVALKSDQTSVG